VQFEADYSHDRIVEGANFPRRPRNFVSTNPAVSGPTCLDHDAARLASRPDHQQSATGPTHPDHDAARLASRPTTREPQRAAPESTHNTARLANHPHPRRRWRNPQQARRRESVRITAGIRMSPR
jgi:hypothetical protein